jgi:hypothetical protein
MQDPPKFTQIWIFGLKTNYLATLVPTLTMPNAKVPTVEVPNSNMVTRQSTEVSMS